jgi:hypothetical protein
MAKPLRESIRKEIFAALVLSQDSGMSVERSRQYVAALFKATAADILEIEREGSSKDWPPL